MGVITFGQAVLACALLAALVFVLLHLRPLNENELLGLSRKRRQKEIRRYFTFFPGPVGINIEFKTKMNPTGKLYRISDSLGDFPSRAAGLMKGKRHEWVMCALERAKVIDVVWLNKGVKAEVSIQLDVSEIVRIAAEGGYTSVLRFHNHPNSHPDQSDLLRPSGQDMISTRFYADRLNAFGLNFLDFVCERGRYLEYCLSPAAIFLPEDEFSRIVKQLNGMSRFRNLLLHLERIF